MANNIDKTEGQWKGFESGDKNTIIFWQQRAQVSVSRIIKWTSALWEKPKNSEEFAKLGPCPLMAFAPTSCDNESDIKVIIAMGLAIGMIGNTDPPENPYPAGSQILNDLDFEKIMAKLRTDLPLRNDIYRQFVIGITINYKQIITRLSTLIEYRKEEYKDSS